MEHGVGIHPILHPVYQIHTRVSQLGTRTLLLIQSLLCVPFRVIRNLKQAPDEAQMRTPKCRR
jgi:hypothetical protein